MLIRDEKNYNLAIILSLIRFLMQNDLTEKQQEDSAATELRKNPLFYLFKLSDYICHGQHRVLKNMKIL